MTYILKDSYKQTVNYNEKVQSTLYNFKGCKDDEDRQDCITWFAVQYHAHIGIH